MENSFLAKIPIVYPPPLFHMESMWNVNIPWNFHEIHVEYVGSIRIPTWNPHGIHMEYIYSQCLKVRSGPVFHLQEAWTETETGLHKSKTCQRLDRTAKDRSTAVGLGLFAVTRPVLTGYGPDQLLTGLDRSYRYRCTGVNMYTMYESYEQPIVSSMLFTTTTSAQAAYLFLFLPRLVYVERRIIGNMHKEGQPNPEREYVSTYPYM